ncbi:hypothetical protein NUU61_008978 [Penicillium alfredii]|uniref:Uncharacterized protein n=1 Tax=Penicillium alfredii TaxID=1506179 RepID=A0A9W9EMF8_9EURO|nr:uncharacterized protein NUU61_008978 [Penicillium alfredii]KAJ5084399.1 hypothetical protein NUU61_008978 [Penicillium alfredii]
MRADGADISVEHPPIPTLNPKLQLIHGELTRSSEGEAEWTGIPLRDSTGWRHETVYRTNRKED